LEAAADFEWLSLEYWKFRGDGFWRVRHRILGAQATEIGRREGLGFCKGGAVCGEEWGRGLGMCDADAASHALEEPGGAVWCLRQVAGGAE
jgi:hypothetical protein